MDFGINDSIYLVREVPGLTLFCGWKQSAVFSFQIYRETKGYPLTSPFNLYTQIIRKNNASLLTVMYSYSMTL